MFETISLQQQELLLKPMTEADCQPLYNLAQRNLAELIYIHGAEQLTWYQQAMIELAQGRSLPFCILLNNQLVGTTRFGDLNSLLPSAEIGWTWLDKSLHGTGINKQIKYLMLNHAFSTWQLVRVQIKTAATNIRSQKAIEKLGAIKEGILRNHRRLANGQLDDTVMYSITPADWLKIKVTLET